MQVSELQFQPTLPLRGATRIPQRRPCPYRGFNPRSPCGERPGPRTTTAPWPSFNPRSPCGERLREVGRLDGSRLVSTHAPLAGSDMVTDGKLWSFCEFQPTLPLRGATRRTGAETGRAACFNPRSPCGERRAATLAQRPRTACFNPRSPCGERPRMSYGNTVKAASFNPRSPCGERLSAHSRSASSVMFQPTLPLRGATFFVSM